MRAWDGKRWRFTPRLDGQESSWEAREREHPGRQAIVWEMMERGVRHIAQTEDLNIQVVGCGDHGNDGAVSREGLEKFIQLAGASGHERQTHFCSFPGMPHPWTRPYIDPSTIFWWTQYSRVAITRFALHGEPFQKMDRGSRGDDASDVCFVDAIADGDTEHAPFAGQEYTARYPFFEPPTLLEQWKEFSFTGLQCGSSLSCETHVWKMGRVVRHSFWHFWRRESYQVFALQPLLARFSESSHPSEEAHHPVPMLAERDEPEVWSSALRRPIRSAWVKATGECEDTPFPSGLGASTEGTGDGACVMIPLRRLMAHGDSKGLATNLVAGALYTAPAGAEEMTLQFCGKESEVTMLMSHMCIA